MRRYICPVCGDGMLMQHLSMQSMQISRYEQTCSKPNHRFSFWAESEVLLYTRGEELGLAYAAHSEALQEDLN